AAVCRGRAGPDRGSPPARAAGAASGPARGPPPPPRPIAIGKRAHVVSRIWRRLPRDPLAIGLATGLLPCAALLPAWALAMAAGSALAGAASMVAFALASSPGLVAAPAGRRLAARVRSPHLQAAAWCALGLFLAFRPLLLAAGCH